ncbi:MAG TPA: ABC transporter substrate-binding protein [Streptosporangiaceae bacterium]|nr:ABC transporter substrate-binding protein [Streptosporangiaceae bacterium]
MPRLPRRFRVFGVAAAAALLAAGCSGSGGGSGAVGGLEQTNLVVAAVPAIDSAGLYIAEQRGFFAQEGLHVSIVRAASSSDVISKQLAGQYAITAGAYPSYIAADVNKNADFRVLVSGSQLAPSVQQIVVPARSKVTKMSQLAGQTIGVNALNNVGTLLVTSMLSDNAIAAKAANGQPNYNFKVIQFPDMGQALNSGQVGAAWLPEPFITEDEETYGVQPLADADEGQAESLPIEGYVVTQSWLDKNPHTAEAFRIALEKAQAIAATNQDAVQSAMTAFAGVRPMAADVLATPDYPTTTQAGPLQRVVSLMVGENMIKQGYNARNLIAKIPSG